MKNSLRERLLSGEVLAGSWIQVASPTVAEVFDACGFDWLAIDCEHTDMGVNDSAAVMRGIRTATPFVRVKSNDPLSIRQPLDCGAVGVIVPLVNSADEARAAVAAAHYPPQGIRGFSFTRANNHGIGFDEYVSRASSETVVIVMIESREAVETIDEIVAVEGVDGVFVGPYDLSGSYGIPGQTDHTLVRDALGTVAAACRRKGKAAGQHIVRPTPDAIASAVSEGFTFLALGMDTVFLADGARSCLATLHTSVSAEG